MSHVNLRREPDGWRAYIKDGNRVIIVDGFFDDELEATQAAVGATNLKP